MDHYHKNKEELDAIPTGGFSGLSNVDNTSDIDKPISILTQSALDLKSDKTNVLELDNTDVYTPTQDYHPTTKLYVDTSIGAGGGSHTHTNLIELNKITVGDHDILTDNPHSVTQTQIGLSNVDNTSDIDKPISTLTQSALDLKSNLTDVANLDTLKPSGVISPETNVLGTINTDNTKFDLVPIVYQLNGEIYSYAGGTAIDPGFQVGSNVVLVGLDENGLVFIDEEAYGTSEFKDDDLDILVPILRVQAATGNTGPNSVISQIRPEQNILTKWFTKDRLHYKATIGATYDLAPNSGKLIKSGTTGQLNQLEGRFFDAQKKPIALSAINDLIAVQFTGVSTNPIIIAAPFISYDKYSDDFGVSITDSSISFVAPDRILDSNNGFLTSGFKFDDVLTISSSLNSKSTFEILSVDAGEIIVSSNSPTIINESAGSPVTITTYLRHLESDNYAAHFVMRPTGVTSNYFVKLSKKQYNTRDAATNDDFDFGAFTTAQVIPVARVIMKEGNHEIDTIIDERPLISRQRPAEISPGVTNVADFANGCFLEKPLFYAGVDGTDVKAYILNKSGSQVLTIQFQGLNYILDVSSPLEVILTQGTWENPVTNYIYYELVDNVPTLIKSITGYPTSTEHAKIGEIDVPLYNEVSLYNFPRLWAHTDHIRSHMQHINERLRLEDAVYQTGINNTITVETVAGAKDNIYFSNTVGEVAQLHLYHIFPAQNSQNGDYGFILNHPTTPNKPILNLNNELIDANGDSLSTTRFNIVKFGVASEDGVTIDSKIYFNLPSGSYSTNQDAIDDINNTSVTSVPQRFRGTAILLERITFRHTQSGSNETWEILNIEDLRGKLLGSSVGGSGVSGSQTTFTDSEFDIHGSSDPTKILKFDVSGLSSGTNTITVQDKDYILGDSLKSKQINTQTGTTYVLLLSDNDNIIEMNNSSANTIDIPLNSSVNFDIGTQITIVQYGTGITTVQGVSGVTLNGGDGGSKSTTSQYEGIVIYKRGTDEWIGINK